MLIVCSILSEPVKEPVRLETDDEYVPLSCCLLCVLSSCLSVQLLVHSGIFCAFCCDKLHLQCTKAMYCTIGYFAYVLRCNALSLSHSRSGGWAGHRPIRSR